MSRNRPPLGASPAAASGAVARRQLGVPSASTSRFISGLTRRKLSISSEPPRSGSGFTTRTIFSSVAICGAVPPGALAKRTSLASSAIDGNKDRLRSPPMTRSRPVASCTWAVICSLYFSTGTRNGSATAATTMSTARASSVSRTFFIRGFLRGLHATATAATGVMASGRSARRCRSRTTPSRRLQARWPHALRLLCGICRAESLESAAARRSPENPWCIILEIRVWIDALVPAFAIS